VAPCAPRLLALRQRRSRDTGEVRWASRSDGPMLGVAADSGTPWHRRPSILLKATALAQIAVARRGSLPAAEARSTPAHIRTGRHRSHGSIACNCRLKDMHML